MKIPRLDLLLEYCRSAVRDRDEAVLKATAKFAKDPLHYLTWGDQSLVSTLYRHFLASYVLEAPQQPASMVVRCLRELRRRELSTQLRYHGSSSTNPYSNATEMALAEARSRELDGGWLDESWQLAIIAQSLVAFSSARAVIAHTSMAGGRIRLKIFLHKDPYMAVTPCWF